MHKVLLTTTIHVPHLLRAYANNAQRHGHDDLHILVVCDKKTPPGAAALCAEVARTVPCTYLDVAAQEAFLAPFAELAAHIPYSCIQRRQVGLLWALERGAKVVVTIDDDNFVTGGDFIGLHARVGTTQPLPTYHSTDGWLNVCAHLQCDDDVALYHRGYPQQMRWREREQFVHVSEASRLCVVNAGFWLDDPDIDALTRMHRQPVVRGRKEGTPKQFALAPGTYSPFNSQNTALWHEVLPAYFLSPFVGRYDDIWASYIVCRIAEHLGHTIAFGEPWVRQARNPHDLWRDLDAERIGMQHTDGFCAALRQVSLTASDYHGAFGELTAALPQAWTLPESASDAAKLARERLLAGMALWHAACGQVRAASAQQQRPEAAAAAPSSTKRRHGSALASN
jgi:hypothetical protein